MPDYPMTQTMAALGTLPSPGSGFLPVIRKAQEKANRKVRHEKRKQILKGTTAVRVRCSFCRRRLVVRVDRNVTFREIAYIIHFKVCLEFPPSQRTWLEDFRF
jgi:hypothetical protein